jgi:tetratricopeptide (TPR) repeat protein
MTAPMLMTECPTEETLAAYVDDRLDAATRQKVTEHLTTCGECRELVLMASDFQAEPVPEPLPEPVSGKFGWIAAFGSLAAAAMIAVFMLRGPDMDDVIAASPSISYRPTDGRFGGEFAYKAAYPRKRGPGESELSEQAELIAIALKAKDLHVRGVALLLSTTERDYYEQAVADLKQAHATAREKERDAIAVDLAAALLSRWADEEDHQRALELSEELLKRKRSPAAAWNRAMALELLNRDPEAIKAWNDYLSIEPDAVWKKDAASHRDKLIGYMKDAAAPKPN